MDSYINYIKKKKYSQCTKHKAPHFVMSKVGSSKFNSIQAKKNAL